MPRARREVPAPTGWAAVTGWAGWGEVFVAPMLLLYGGCIAWVIGYDTRLLETLNLGDLT